MNLTERNRVMGQTLGMWLIAFGGTIYLEGIFSKFSSSLWAHALFNYITLKCLFLAIRQIVRKLEQKYPRG